METATEVRWFQYRRTAGITLAGPWLLSWVVSAVLLNTLKMGEGARTIVGLLPLPAFGWFLWRYIAHVRGLDEMRHRIELEALAIAFPLSVAFLMTLGQVQTARPGAGGVPVTSGFWLYLALFYLLGRGIAARRYA